MIAENLKKIKYLEQLIVNYSKKPKFSTRLAFQVALFYYCKKGESNV